MRRFFPTVIILVSCLVLAGTVSAQQAGDAVAVSRIMDAWQKRRTAIDAVT